MKKLLKVLLLSFVFLGVFAASTANTYAMESGNYPIANPNNFFVGYDADWEHFWIDSQSNTTPYSFSITLSADYTMTNQKSSGAESVSLLKNDVVSFSGDGPGAYINVQRGGTTVQNSALGGFITNGFQFTKVGDITRPAISGQENFVTNVDDPKNVAHFQSFLSAYDETDGDITNRITVKTDNYTANKSVLGTHQIIFSVKDLSNNEATLTVYVRVVDVTKPIISGNTSVTQIGYKETWNINTFKSTLTVTDNYDTLTNADITVKTDGYTSNKNKLGTYDVVFKATDQSDNEGTFTKQVKVIDNIKPTFSGPTTIATSNTTIITESQIRSQLTAHDEIDGNITNKIQLVEDNFTGKGNAVGNYTIKYSVADNAGNTEFRTVTITRSDTMPPIFWIQDGVSIIVEPTVALTKQQIIDTLTASGQINVTATTQVMFLSNEYEGNESTPGVYAISMRVADLKGNEEIHNVAITVLDTEEDDNPIVLEPKEPVIKLPDWAPEWMHDYLDEILIGLVIISVGLLLFAFFKVKKHFKKSKPSVKRKK